MKFNLIARERVRRGDISVKMNYSLASTMMELHHNNVWRVEDQEMECACVEALCYTPHRYLSLRLDHTS